MIHVPVLTKEVLEYLAVKPGDNIVDCTVGEGNHAKLILKKSAPSGRLLGIDWDKTQIENSRRNLAAVEGRVVLVNDSYVNLSAIVQRENFPMVRGILADLGMSSWQLEASGKGFSFMKDELLDMRYSKETQLTASQIINEYPEEKLVIILAEYGEEPFARKIAKAIVKERHHKNIQTTFQLKEIIEQAVSKKFQRGKIHAATKTFQALRLAVNGELDNLTRFLPQAFSVLSSGGRLVIISFHSLEDRIVKHFLKDKENKSQAKLLTKKPVMASLEEINNNPRARSAKLRAIIKN